MQNSQSHVWYEQLALELPEENALGWKSFCKLHFGISILRSENTEYKKVYDNAIKGLSYEQKLEVMKFYPVTSIMTKAQLSAYFEAMQNHFVTRGVTLEFLR